MLGLDLTGFQNLSGLDGQEKLCILCASGVNLCSW